MNAQVHHIEGQGKEDKQVKQHDYVTSSQSDEGPNHHNTSKMFNSVRSTVYYTLVECYHAQSKREKGNKKRRGRWLECDEMPQ